MKTCSTCKREQPVTEFWRQSDKSDGLTCQCKTCIRARQRSKADQRRVYNAEYNAANKDAIKAQQKKYHAENREARLAQHREYVKANAARIQRQNQDWKNAKFRTDPLFALKLRIKNRVKAAFRKAGYRAGTQTQKILGCSYEQFKCHLESHFQPGMSWANRSEWHIDHHVPLASAKTADELLTLNHHTNLRPLWALDNIKKGASMPNAAQP
jgi:hypothetical protein